MAPLYLPVPMACPAWGTHAAVPALWRGDVSRHQPLGAVSVVMARGALKFSDPDSWGTWRWGKIGIPYLPASGPRAVPPPVQLFKEECEP